MTNLILIGMPGTGKSTVGVLLAKRLGMDFLDTDLMIIKKSGKTLPDLLSLMGVEGFLSLENEVGAAIRCEHTVIATGGSMVFSHEAMQNLKSLGVVIWLDTKLTELERRIKRSADRGIAAEPDATVAEIDQKRRPLYQKHADITISCSGNTDHVAAQVVKALAQHVRRSRP